MATVYLSVIIPVYNTEKYLEKCVKSVINQNFSGYEILLIDDGSTDKSSVICDSFAKEYDFIKVIHKENGGLSSARNCGIKNAVGKYITFIDSDDYLSDNAFSFMYERALSSECDVLLCGLIYEEENGEKRYVFSHDCILTKENINSEMISLKSKNLIDTAVNKFYSSAFLKENGMLFSEGEIFEDTDFNLRLLEKKPKICVCSECFYHYLQHSGSITKRFNKDKAETLKKRARLLKRVTDGIDSYCDYYFVKCLFSAFADLFLDKSMTLKKRLRFIKNEVKTEEFSSASKNAYFDGKSAKLTLFFAKTGSPLLIDLYCKAVYLLKYKFRNIFARVRE